jgi:hypothetical protein
MSLDDKFNPEGDTLIDRLDSALFNFNKKLAQGYQNITHKDKADLERTLYFGSAALSGGVAFDNTDLIRYLLIPPLFSSLVKGTFEDMRPKNNLSDRIRSETYESPSKFYKYSNLLFYTFGILSTSLGVIGLVNELITGDNQSYHHSLNLLGLGIGLVSYSSADYMAKSDLGSPPQKPKKKPVLERIKEKFGELVPPPTNETILLKVNNYSISKYINS